MGCSPFSGAIGGDDVLQQELLPEILRNAVSSNAVQDVETITIHYSHYWPAFGGINCSNFVNGECISRMANGERWQDYIGEALACPRDMMGTQIEAFGSVWTCRDTGGLIQYVDGIPWIDFLVQNPHVNYGSIIEVVVK